MDQGLKDAALDRAYDDWTKYFEIAKSQASE